MAEHKTHYARYVFVRGNQSLWKGDAAQKGAQFRQVVITSDEWMLSDGKFQVYALEGIGNGIEAGKFSTVPTPKVLFDGDFDGEKAAADKFQEIVARAESDGFRAVTLFEEMEFHEKLRSSRI